MSSSTDPPEDAVPIRALVDFRIHRPFRTGIGRYLEGLTLALERRADVVPTIAARRGSSGEAWARERGLPVHHIGPQRVPALIRPGVFDVFHLTYPITAPAFGIPTVVTVHDLIYDDPRWAGRAKRVAFRLTTQLVLRKARAVVAVSQSTAEQLRTRRGPRAPVFVAPNGVEDGPISPQADREAHHLVYVGSLRRHKGIEVLLKAMCDAPAAHLTVLSSESTHLWSQLSSVLTAPARSRVRFIPFADDALRLDLLRRAAAVVVPSRMEGFGLPVLEALAAGAPVICSDIPVFREVAGDHARYFPDGDNHALADILRAGHFPLPDSGVRDQVAKFTWDRAAYQVSRAYARALRRTVGDA